MLDFLNEKLQWRDNKEYTITKVKEIKSKCFTNPKKSLWMGTTKEID